MPPDAAPLNSARMPSSVFSTLRQLLRLVDRPVLLRRQADARAVGAAALVGAAEGRGRGPGGRHELRHRQARRQHLLLERRDVLRIDQRVVDRRDRVLPDQLFGRHLGAEVARARAHVAVRQLEPGAREGVGELVGVGEEAARDLLVGRVEAQRQVGGEHRRRQALRRVVRVRDGAGTGAALGHPLLRAGRALRQLPLEAEQVLEEVVAPLRRRGGPGDLQAAGDGVAALAGAEAVASSRGPAPRCRQASGSLPTCEAGAAPCVLPKVWPPAISATVSSSSIAMRPKVSRMSCAAAIGSGLPSGPSGLT